MDLALSPSPSARHAFEASDPHRQEFVRLVILYLTTMLAAIWGIAFLVGRQANQSIQSLNRQMELMDPSNPGRKLELENADDEVVLLKNHINELLSRIQLTIIHLRQYAAQVAHELRAPLTIIRFKIEEAADKVDPDLAEEIQTELMRLNLHVEQALLVARAEQGHVALHRERFNLDRLLSDILEDFRLLGQEQRRNFVYKGEPSPVSADPKYVKQIIYNLLTNSLRHGQGDVEIRLRQRRNTVSLLIANSTKPPEADSLDLGVGRRIVNALVSLHKNMQIQTRRTDRSYIVILRLSCNGQEGETADG
jgi:signal transduction histidine kinase